MVKLNKVARNKYLNVPKRYRHIPDEDQLLIYMLEILELPEHEILAAVRNETFSSGDLERLCKAIRGYISECLTVGRPVPCGGYITNELPSQITQEGDQR